MVTTNDCPVSVGLTWTGGNRSESLAFEVRQALDLGIEVLLAHEMPGVGGQASRHGVEFGTFIACQEGVTPPDLLKRDLYSDIAVPLKGGAWREASMVLLAETMVDLHCRARGRDEGTAGNVFERNSMQSPVRRASLLTRVNGLSAARISHGEIFSRQTNAGQMSNALERPSVATGLACGTARASVRIGASSECGYQRPRKSRALHDETSSASRESRQSQKVCDLAEESSLPKPSRLPPPSCRSSSAVEGEHCSDAEHSIRARRAVQWACSIEDSDAPQDGSDAPQDGSDATRKDNLWRRLQSSRSAGVIRNVDSRKSHLDDADDEMRQPQPISTSRLKSLHAAALSHRSLLRTQRSSPEQTPAALPTPMHTRRGSVEPPPRGWTSSRHITTDLPAMHTRRGSVEAPPRVHRSASSHALEATATGGEVGALRSSSARPSNVVTRYGASVTLTEDAPSSEKSSLHASHPSSLSTALSEENVAHRTRVKI